MPSETPSGTADAPSTEVLRRGDTEVKVWGSSLELQEVTPKEAQEAYLDATDPTRALTPPTAEAVKARDDMLKDRFTYVQTHVNNPAAQYVVMGKTGSVAPESISQGSFIIATLVVLMGAVGAVVYVRTQWGVTSGKELGDRLRERGAAKKEALERSQSATLMRSISQTAELSVKENVDVVRRPSQQLGLHLNESFKGVVKEGRPGGGGRPTPEAAAPAK